jgi:pimeloyl-ACP methyl ester carboxylesterase
MATMTIATIPVHTKRLSTGVTLEYVEWGNPLGEPVICLHGVTDSWRSFEGVLPHLPDDLRVFAVTQRGHGGSSKPASGYRYTDFAADVRAFMDACELPAAVLVGHSMGSLVAQRAAIDYPSRVRGLALVAAFLTIHGDREIEDFWNTTLWPLSDPIPRDVAMGFQLSTLATAIPQPQLDLFVEESCRTPAHVWRATFREFLDTDFTSELGRISAPALMLWGERDAYCGPTHWTGLTSAIPHAQAQVYGDAGHALHWEQPARVARDLVTFVRRLTPRDHGRAEESNDRHA